MMKEQNKEFLAGYIFAEIQRIMYTSKKLCCIIRVEKYAIFFGGIVYECIKKKLKFLLCTFIFNKIMGDSSPNTTSLLRKHGITVISENDVNKNIK